MTNARRLPATRTGTCHRCDATIVWAITVAGPNGPGGKAIPLDTHETPNGNVAVVNRTHGRLYARVLHKDETHDTHAEYLAMPHFATCTARQARTPELSQLPDNVIPLRRRPANHRSQ